MPLDFSFTACEGNTCKYFEVSDLTGLYDPITNPGGYGNVEAIPPVPSSNIDLGDVTSAVINVTLPGGNIPVIVDAFPTLPNLGDPSFKVTSELLGLSANQDLPDGIYCIEYVIAGEYAITIVNQATQEFTIPNDKTGVYSPGDTITVVGSTGNDGTYTVNTITLIGPDTVIQVLEPIPSAIANGTILFEESKETCQAFLCGLKCCLHEQLDKIELEDCDCRSEALKLASTINTFIQTIKYAIRCGKQNRANKLIAHVQKLCNSKKCASC